VKEQMAMSQLPQTLLSAALRVQWEQGHLGERHALRLLAERVPGFREDEYAVAYRYAETLDATAWQMAEEWQASRGQAIVTQEVLAEACPGFADSDYAEALSKNLTWARK
jgi:hypothetical protein